MLQNLISFSILYFDIVASQNKKDKKLCGPKIFFLVILSGINLLFLKSREVSTFLWATQVIYKCTEVITYGEWIFKILGTLKIPTRYCVQELLWLQLCDLS